MAQRENIATWPKDRANRVSIRTPEALSGTRVITLAEVEQWQVMSFDANGAGRNVDLPAVAASRGVQLTIINTSSTAVTLTIRNAGGTTICTAAQNKRATVWCDGTTWYGLVGATT